MDLLLFDDERRTFPLVGSKLQLDAWHRTMEMQDRDASDAEFE